MHCVQNQVSVGDSRNKTGQLERNPGWSEILRMNRG